MDKDLKERIETLEEDKILASALAYYLQYFDLDMIDELLGVDVVKEHGVMTAYEAHDEIINRMVKVQRMRGYD
jgi:hypothetical protein